jgi:hypothetical protein
MRSQLLIRDDHKTVGALDDSLGRSLVARKNNKVGLVCPDPGVLGGVDLQRGVRAPEVAALAYEQADSGFVPLRELGDPVVHLTQKALITGTWSESAGSVRATSAVRVETADPVGCRVAALLAVHD